MSQRSRTAASTPERTVARAEPGVRQDWWAPAGVFVLALLVRGVYLLQIRSIGFFTQPASDAFIYVQRARSIAGGDWLGPADFVHAPLYAYILACLHLFGGEFWAYRVLQILFGATACALLVMVGRRLFGPRTGLLAGLLLALYPPALFFDGLIQKTSLTLLLSTLLIWLLLGMGEKPRWWRFAATGLTLGLLVLTRQNTLALVPLVVAWLILGQRGLPVRSRHVRAGVCAAALVITLLPWAVRNKFVIGDFVLTTPNFGQNFAMGNSETATGTYTELRTGTGHGEDEQMYWVDTAARALGHTPSAQEVSDYFLNQAMTWVKANPTAWLMLQVKKWFLVWNSYESFDTEDYYLYCEHAPLLGALDRVWHFGVLAPLAAVGLVLTLGQWRRLWLLYGWLVLTALSVAIFVVFARYRFPLIPVLCLFASAGVAELVGHIRTRRFDRVSLAAVALLVAAIATNWTIDSPRSTQPMSYVNHATVLNAVRRHDEALAELQKALAQSPDDVAANLGMCVTLTSLGRYDEAVPYGQRARDGAPEYADPLTALGDALLGEEKTEEGLAMYRQALELDPLDYRTMNVLASALARLQRLPEAMELFVKIQALAPDYAEGHLNRGNACYLAGDFDAAQRAYERTLALWPDCVEALHNLGAVALARGDAAGAVKLFERCLRIDPTYERARRSLEAVRAAQRP